MSWYVSFQVFASANLSVSDLFINCLIEITLLIYLVWVMILWDIALSLVNLLTLSMLKFPWSTALKINLKASGRFIEGVAILGYWRLVHHIRSKSSQSCPIKWLLIFRSLMSSLTHPSTVSVFIILITPSQYAYYFNDHILN